MKQRKQEAGSTGGKHNHPHSNPDMEAQPAKPEPDYSNYIKLWTLLVIFTTLGLAACIVLGLRVAGVLTW